MLIKHNAFKWIFLVCFCFSFKHSIFWLNVFADLFESIDVWMKRLKGKGYLLSWLLTIDAFLSGEMSICVCRHFQVNSQLNSLCPWKYPFFESLWKWVKSKQCFSRTDFEQNSQAQKSTPKWPLSSKHNHWGHTNRLV